MQLVGKPTTSYPEGPPCSIQPLEPWHLSNDCRIVHRQGRAVCRSGEYPNQSFFVVHDAVRRPDPSGAEDGILGGHNTSHCWRGIGRCACTNVLIQGVSHHSQAHCVFAATWLTNTCFRAREANAQRLSSLLAVLSSV